MRKLHLASVVLLSFLAVLPSSAFSDEPRPAAHPDLKPLLPAVQRVVKKHYPLAKVTLDEPNTIHFEYNTRNFMVHHANMVGDWQDAREELGPRPGGIYGDIRLVPGDYSGQLGLPQIFNMWYFKVWASTSYSRRLDHHLRVSVKYPLNVSRGFLTEFNTLVEGFEQQLTGKPRDVDAPHRDPEKLRGTWVLESVDGKKVEHPGVTRVTFGSSSAFFNPGVRSAPFFFHHGNVRYEVGCSQGGRGTLDLVDVDKPRTSSKPASGHTPVYRIAGRVMCIYRVEGDVLEICSALRAGAERPTVFKVADAFGEEQHFLRLKRVRPLRK